MNRVGVLFGAGALAGLAVLFLRPRGAQASVPKPPPAPSASPPSSTPSGASAGGRLLSAAQAGKLDPINWATIRLGDLDVEVAADALSAEGVRWPVTFNESIEIARALGAILPTKAIADAMVANAAVRIEAMPQDVATMMSENTSRKFSAAIDKTINGRPGLRAGGWKHWILDPRLTTSKGAVNYGFWQGNKPIQSVGGMHNAQHYDYSQLLQPVKRYAKKAPTGESVDLLEIINAETDGKIKPWLDKLS